MLTLAVPWAVTVTGSPQQAAVWALPAYVTVNVQRFNENCHRAGENLLLTYLPA
jgi:hypothetical protein